MTSEKLETPISPPAWVAIIGGALLVGVLFTGVLWWSDSPETSADHVEQASFEPHFHDGEGEEAQGSDEIDHFQGENSQGGTVQNEDSSDRADHARRRDTASTAREEVLDESDEDPDTQGDLGSQQESQRPEGLGPTHWMAEAEDVDVEELEEQLAEGEQRQARELAMRTDQRRSVTAVKPPLEKCFEELRLRHKDPGYRIALGWTVRTSGATGIIESPQIIHHIGASDDSFEDCVVDAVDGLDFEAVSDGEEVEVEYGFFLE